MQMRGQKTEAQESVTAFLKRRPADAPSVAVAVTNLIALRGPKDVADGLKRLEKIVVPVGGGGEGKEGGMGGKGGGGGGLSAGGGEGGVTELRFEDNLEVKLSRRQKAAVLQNRFLLLLLANRADEVSESQDAFISYRCTHGTDLSRPLLLLLASRVDEVSQPCRQGGQRGWEEACKAMVPFSAILQRFSPPILSPCFLSPLSQI